MISEPEWASVLAVAQKAAADISGGRSEWFHTGRVIKRDEKNKLVWISGMAQTAIPIVGFHYDIRYYDTDENGHATVRTAHASVVVPKVGEYVLVAFEMGSSRLPRCLGVVQGKNYLESEED